MKQKVKNLLSKKAKKNKVKTIYKEIPVETIVFRDREVKVPVSFENIQLTGKLPTYGRKCVLVLADAATKDMIVIGHRTHSNLDGEHYTCDTGSKTSVIGWFYTPTVLVNKQINSNNF